MKMKKFVSVFLALVFLIGLCLPAAADTSYAEVKRSLRLPYGSATTATLLNVDNKYAISLDNLIFFLDLKSRGSVGSKDTVITSSDGSVEITITPGSDTVKINGKSSKMPFASFTYNNSLYVPFTYLCGALNLKTYTHKNGTLYIQDASQYKLAEEIMNNSLAAVWQQKTLKTTSNQNTKMQYYVDTGELVSTGVTYTDLENMVAYSYTQGTYSLGKTYRDNPTSTEKLADTYEYITPSGIYSRNAGGTYDKEPPLPENISVVDMATKSVYSDTELFLYSATVEKSGNTYTVKAQTDIGSLTQVHFTFYMPEVVNTLNWTDASQTITYDAGTYLPKTLSLRFYADYVPDASTSEKMYLTYENEYIFKFGAPVDIKLPVGVE